MVKPFDISRLRKSLTKSVPGMSVGFRDPDTWISTGNYTLNKLISGDWHKGVPLGKVTVFAGESGSGKSFLASGNIVKNAQEQGIFVILIDSENALDKTWLNALDVDTSEDKLLKLNVAMIDDVAKIIYDFIKEYKADYADKPDAERPKVLFVIDSLGMLLTPTDIDQFSKGDLKGDMGRKPKALKALVTNCVNMFGDYNIGLVATNHVYASQNMFDPDPVVSGGSGFIFASSILVAINKLKLKTDENGAKTTDVQGIRAVCKVMKTRYAKPFEKVELEIPYSTGLDPYSGMFDFFQKAELLKKSGNRWEYISESTGEVIKLYEKEWNRNTNSCLDTVMSEFDQLITLSLGNNVETVSEEIDVENQSE
jgi:RecA/RadA recombinase